jgi:glucose/arabinose dehydrogenase
MNMRLLVLSLFGGLTVLLFASCQSLDAQEAAVTLEPTSVLGVETEFQTQASATETTDQLPTEPSTQPALSVTPLPSLTPQAAPTNQGELILQSFPDSSLYTWQVVSSGFSKPVDLDHAGDDSGRLFVVEQSGVVRVLDNGILRDVPFLDIQSRVGSSASEQGLLGLAFHPNYEENGFFYVNYTDLQGNTVISRFLVSDENPNLADAESEFRLLSILQPYPNHNGGSVVFGPDHYLYLGLGDGGSGGDPENNGQSLNSLLGKILRIDVDQGEPYAVPEDNPFYSGGGLPEIWTYGLRNPWRIAFDRLTGDLYIGDVGQNQWEEINFVSANSSGGENFGWRFFEGSYPYQGQPPENVQLVPPIAEYGHDQGCSVTGGVVYRGQKFLNWQGIYIYGDYCTGNVWGLLREADATWKQMLLFENMGQISSFAEDEIGEIYLIDHNGSVLTLVKK